MYSVVLWYCSYYWPRRHSGVGWPTATQRSTRSIADITVCHMKETANLMHWLILCVPLCCKYKTQSQKDSWKTEAQRDVFGVLFLFTSLPLFVRFSIIPFPLGTSFHISLTSLDTDKLIITSDCVLPRYIMAKQSTVRVNVPFQRVRAKWGWSCLSVSRKRDGRNDVARGNKRTRDLWHRVIHKLYCDCARFDVPT